MVGWLATFALIVLISSCLMATGASSFRAVSLLFSALFLIGLVTTKLRDRV